jgi:FkbM family methyltransferase
MQTTNMRTLKATAKRYLVYIKNQIFPRKTYSQHNEDLVIQLLLGNINKFIDIGANDGINVSSTFLFSLKGASGMCFEPVYSTFLMLQSLYRLNNKIICIQEGISNQTKEIEIQREGLLSYIPETLDPLIQEILEPYYSKTVDLETIKVKPLSYWCDHYPEFLRCDFVNIDVEGHEFNALQGIDFSTFQTKCFVIETNGDQRHDYSKIDNLLKENRYHALLRNSLNTFWFLENLNNDLDFHKNLKKIPIAYSEYEILSGGNAEFG